MNTFFIDETSQGEGTTSLESIPLNDEPATSTGEPIVKGNDSEKFPIEVLIIFGVVGLLGIPSSIYLVVKSQSSTKEDLDQQPSATTTKHNQLLWAGIIWGLLSIFFLAMSLYVEYRLMNKSAYLTFLGKPINM